MAADLQPDGDMGPHNVHGPIYPSRSERLLCARGKAATTSSSVCVTLSGAEVRAHRRVASADRSAATAHAQCSNRE
jgi:hypothetical protein